MSEENRMFGVVPAFENAQTASSRAEDEKDKAFWIMLQGVVEDDAVYPQPWMYECSRCESASPNALRECPVCGAEMSNMVVQYMWVDFDQ